MTDKFIREKDLVERLMQRLGLVADRYDDPNADGAETGADVLVIYQHRRIGVQVTVLDRGAIRGQAIATEKKLAKEATKTTGGVYGSWGQTQPLDAIAAAIRRKAATDVAGFGEVWLLVSCGIPEPGALVSTSVMTAWLSASALNAVTADELSRSVYSRAFLHPIVALEDALYEWTPARHWEKHINAPTRLTGPSFWDIRRKLREKFGFR